MSNTRRFNCTYIQPHTALAENITSHAIDTDMFLEIMDTYKLSVSNGRVVTRYYYEDQILEVDEAGRMSSYVAHLHDRHIDTCYELVIANQTTSSVMRFPLSKDYHHVRQSIVFTVDMDNWRLELEMLVVGIKHSATRRQEIYLLLDQLKTPKSADESDIVSLSFRLFSKSNSTKEFLYEYHKIKGLCRSDRDELISE